MGKRIVILILNLLIGIALCACTSQSKDNAVFVQSSASDILIQSFVGDLNLDHVDDVINIKSSSVGNGIEYYGDKLPPSSYIEFIDGSSGEIHTYHILKEIEKVYNNDWLYIRSVEVLNMANGLKIFIKYASPNSIYTAGQLIAIKDGTVIRQNIMFMSGFNDLVPIILETDGSCNEIKGSLNVSIFTRWDCVGTISANYQIESDGIISADYYYE